MSVPALPQIHVERFNKESPRFEPSCFGRHDIWHVWRHSIGSEVQPQPTLTRRIVLTRSISQFADCCASFQKPTRSYTTVTVPV
jgi:hypothetical protein